MSDGVAMAEMAFAVRGDLLVAVHNSRAPSQTRWEEFCRECRRLFVELGRLESRAVLVISDGGGPNVLQRAQLLKAMERAVVRTAALSSSPAVRQISAVFQLFNSSASCFDVEEWRDAMDHLGLMPRQFGEVADVLESVSEQVSGAVTAPWLCHQLHREHQRFRRKCASGIQDAAVAVERPMSFLRRFRRGA